MIKIEPMSIDEIKELTKDIKYEPISIASLILAWAHERARGLLWCNRFAYINNGKSHLVWLNEVLDEINWPKEGR